jgi:hypothetical protein
VEVHQALAKMGLKICETQPPGLIDGGDVFVCIRPSFCWKEQVLIPYCISKVLSFHILSHLRCVTSTTTLIELPKGIIRSLRCLGAGFFLKNGLRKCFITCILVIPLLLLYN